MAGNMTKRIVALFDVDGTLTVPRNVSHSTSARIARHPKQSSKRYPEAFFEMQNADPQTLKFLQELRRVRRLCQFPTSHPHSSNGSALHIYIL